MKDHFKFYIFLVRGAIAHGLRMLSYKCILSIEDIPLTPTCLVSSVSLDLFVSAFPSYVIFMCLSESLGLTYERVHLCFEHWCNSLNTNFSLHPFSCKSHDFIFLYGGKNPMACLCHILPSSGRTPRLVP